MANFAGGFRGSERRRDGSTIKTTVPGIGLPVAHPSIVESVREEKAWDVAAAVGVSWSSADFFGAGSAARQLDTAKRLHPGVGS